VGTARFCFSLVHCFSSSCLKVSSLAFIGFHGNIVWFGDTVFSVAALGWVCTRGSIRWVADGTGTTPLDMNRGYPPTPQDILLSRGASPPSLKQNHAEDAAGAFPHPPLGFPQRDPPKGVLPKGSP
jgi:hypothetical protein